MKWKKATYSSRPALHIQVPIYVQDKEHVVYTKTEGQEWNNLQRKKSDKYTSYTNGVCSNSVTGAMRLWLKWVRYNLMRINSVSSVGLMILLYNNNNNTFVVTLLRKANTFVDSLCIFNNFFFIIQLLLYSSLFCSARFSAHFMQQYWCTEENR